MGSSVGGGGGGSTKGMRRSLSPLAANSALAIAGAITGVEGSPVPLGASSLGTIRTWMRGIDAIVSSG